MTTAFFTHESGLAHVAPEGHPEREARLEAIYAALRDESFVGLTRLVAPLAESAELERCHSESYISHVKSALPEQGWKMLDGDTYLSPESWNAALRAVGGVNAAVDAVLAGRVRNAFVAMRPPGHHAQMDRAMGFCLFGTAAIAAKRALDQHQLGRVAVLDFDVHHGNGTQDLLWHEPRAFFASSHQMPLYPGTGSASERGQYGQIVNVPLPAGSGGAQMRRVWEGILAQAAEFRPELILVSAGFDAHRDDPLANLMWLESDFAWLTHAICDLADDVCAGRVVSTLEGGYDLEALGASVAAHVRVLMERGQ
jgi:acetoin utilization deacetylase AcuC-like enzyme